MDIRTRRKAAQEHLVKQRSMAERMAYDEEAERRHAKHLDWMQTPGDGYANVGPLSPVALEVCLRCSAVIYGRERHDAWHASF